MPGAQYARPYPGPPSNATVQAAAAMEEAIDDLYLPLEGVVSHFQDDGSEYGSIAARSIRRLYDSLRERWRVLAQTIAP